jgi:hypothetical protein
MECSVRSDWYVVHGMFCMKIGALNVVLGRQCTGCGVGMNSGTCTTMHTMCGNWVVNLHSYLRHCSCPRSDTKGDLRDY